MYFNKYVLGIPLSCSPDDPDIKTVEMTAYEYYELCERIRTAERKKDAAELEAADADERCQMAFEAGQIIMKDSEAEISRLKKEISDHDQAHAKELEKLKATSAPEALEAKIKSLEKQLLDTKKDLDRAQVIIDTLNGDHDRWAAEQKKNSNLIRIMREKANQSRGIRPYKKRSGYILLSMAPASPAYLKEHPSQVCRVRMQTPYKMDLAPELVRKRVSEDCREIGFWSKLSVEYIWCDESEIEAIRDARSGYYEAAFYTSESTGPIDKDFIQDKKQARR